MLLVERSGGGQNFFVPSYTWMLVLPNSCWSVLYLSKIKFEESSSTNWIFGLNQTGVLQATPAVKIKFEIDKKFICRVWFFQLNFLKINCRSKGWKKSLCLQAKLHVLKKNEKSLVANSNVHTLHRWPYENKKNVWKQIVWCLIYRYYGCLIYNALAPMLWSTYVSM